MVRNNVLNIKNMGLSNPLWGFIIVILEYSVLLFLILEKKLPLRFLFYLITFHLIIYHIVDISEPGLLFFDTIFLPVLLFLIFVLDLVKELKLWDFAKRKVKIPVLVSVLISVIVLVGWGFLNKRASEINLYEIAFYERLYENNTDKEYGIELAKIYSRYSLDNNAAQLMEEYLPDPECFFRIGLLNMWNNYFEESRFMLEKSIEYGFDENKALNAIGVSYLMEKNYDDAVKTFEKALENANTYETSDILINLSEVELESENHDNALQLLKLAFDKLPEDTLSTLIHLKLATHYLYIYDDEPKAEKLIRLGLRRNQDFELYRLAGTLYSEINEPKKAIICLRRAKALCNNSKIRNELDLKIQEIFYDEIKKHNT
ncbi:tetratricopeptide repeat protein [bacterium]|nr:tetratricopeptide repeat protein [bacterium]